MYSEYGLIDQSLIHFCVKVLRNPLKFTTLLLHSECLL